MSAVEEVRHEPAAAKRGERRSFAWLTDEPSATAVALCLLGLVAVSTALRAGLVTFVHAPTVFSDELGYVKLAESIGRHGRLALFDHRGLSYSPLYPLIISPIYALGASAPTAYMLIKFVNALLVSLALIPTYKIARFALPRRLSLVVAGLAAVAPLMVYPSFTMSENAAYPLCLFAVWMLLEALRTPGAGKDALFVVSVLLATAARVQLIVLVPVALTAILLDGLMRPSGDAETGGSVGRALGEHKLLLGVVGAGLVLAATVEAAGRDVLGAFGRYANVGHEGPPNIGHFLYVLVQHIAGVDLAVGVVPFVAALVVAFVFVTGGRARVRRSYVPFAVVAVSLTTWLVLEVAWDAAVFDTGGDLPRIHERFLIYVLPLFLVAPFVAYRMVEGKTRARAYLVAATIATLLPLAIPFHTVINSTIVVDSFALNPYARAAGTSLTAAPHAALIAVWFAGTLSLLYVRMRKRLPAIVLLVLVPFLGITIITQSRIDDGGNFARSLLPEQTDWIDQAHPAGSVVLVTARRPVTRELETAYANLSIARVYSLCDMALGSEFGEKHATIARGGRLRGPSGLVVAPYVVGPSYLRPRGRVVARNSAGHEVLVAPIEGRIGVDRASLKCN